MKPTFDNVIIKMEERGEETTAGGIILQNEKKQPQSGIVMYSASSLFKPDDKVIFNKYKSIDFEYAGENYFAISPEHILAVV